MGTKFVRHKKTLSDVFPLFNRTFAIWTKRRIFPLSFGGRSRAVTGGHGPLFVRRGRGITHRTERDCFVRLTVFGRSSTLDSTHYLPVLMTMVWSPALFPKGWRIPKA